MGCDEILIFLLIKEAVDFGSALELVHSSNPVKTNRFSYLNPTEQLKKVILMRLEFCFFFNLGFQNR